MFIPAPDTTRSQFPPMWEVVSSGDNKMKLKKQCSVLIGPFGI